jgi:hypothetical protein
VDVHAVNGIFRRAGALADRRNAALG